MRDSSTKQKLMRLASRINLTLAKVINQKLVKTLNNEAKVNALRASTLGTEAP